MIINFSDFSPTQRYHLMTQTIIPRPIAWVLTHHGDLDNSINSIPPEQLNLAPFSYFTAISSDPALMMISVGKKPTGDNKDTLTNVLRNKKMVIHIPSTKQSDLVTASAATLAYGESELININDQRLTTTAFDNFPLPRLTQCDIAYGCELYEIKEIGNTPQALIFVEVKQLYLNPEVILEEGDNRLKIYADKVAPLARLGANEYASITEPFKKVRPE